MNHVPMKVTASSLAHPMKATRRALAKQQTREKILAAARELFAERGYEGATIRDIARSAGMSTGAVFASFADKSELFDEIVTADCAALEDAMRQAPTAGAAVDEALAGLFAVAYRFHLGQLQLKRANLAVSWTRDEESERRSREALRPVFDLVLQALRRGVERGDLARTADVRLIGSILWDLYLAGYRAAIFEGRGEDELVARFGERLQVILAGARA
jgi:AcrR family transcriptional regulator